MLRSTMVAAVMIGVLALGPSLRAADKDDVKTTATTVATGLQNGDSAAVKAVCTGSEKQVEFVGIVVDLTKSIKGLSDAAGKKFGDAGKAVIKDSGNPGEQFARQLADADIKIEGDVATLSAKDSKEEVAKLKKIDGKWKMDLTAMSNQDEMDKASGMFKAMSKAAADAAADITAGKFKTADEARQAVDSRMTAAIFAAAGPTSQPAK